MDKKIILSKKRSVRLVKSILRRVFGGRGVCNALSGAVYAFKLLQIRK